MTIDDEEQQTEYRVSIRLTKEDFDRLERLREMLQAKKGRTVRVTQRTVVIEAMEVYERELTRPRTKRTN